MSATASTGAKNTAKRECETLGCENNPIGAGYCGECIAISPNIADDEDVGPWVGVEFNSPESDVWPSRASNRDQWMGRVEKQPFAPWGDSDVPAPCSEDGHDTADKCDCDARWKWGFTENHVTCEAVPADDIHCLDGRVFIQTEADPFAYVDGDDVRDPETGEVHPAFVEVLDQLGLTYADVSQSGCGAHAVYRGALPEGVKETSWQLDSEPFGANDDCPSIEIYARKRVCVMTGEHVLGTPEYARQWDEEALVDVLRDADELPEPTFRATKTDSTRTHGTPVRRVWPKPPKTSGTLFTHSTPSTRAALPRER